MISKSFDTDTKVFEIFEHTNHVLNIYLILDRENSFLLMLGRKEFCSEYSSGSILESRVQFSSKAFYK